MAGLSQNRQSYTGSIAHDQLQLATYTLECLDASTRHYTTGVFIDKFKVSLWYFDRACIIRTRTFDLTEEPVKLAILFYDIYKSSLRLPSAGFDPWV
jgi:hypothetical protein